MRKIGILGGTFNPPHLGHLNMAIKAKEKLSLDQVWFIPAGNPPHKEISDHISIYDRFNMVSLMVKEYNDFYCKNFEYEDLEKSYTFQTLLRLKTKYPLDEFYFIIGADSLKSFDSWYKPEIISSLCNICVCDRDFMDESELDELCAEKEEKYSGKFYPVHMKDVPISSSVIRSSHDLSKIKEYIHPEVINYITEHKLYYKIDISGWYDTDDILDDLKLKLKPSRLMHTIGVMDTACALAMRYSYPVELAKYAGLLHDSAKYLSDDELLLEAEKNNLPISDSERKMPFLLHGKVGACFAQNRYNVNNQEIRHAIEVHTTGCPGMSLLDKIIFVADYIEPQRTKQKNLNEIRILAFNDLDLCVKMILRDTINYLNSSNKEMDNATLETYNYYMEESNGSRSCD